MRTRIGILIIVIGAVLLWVGFRVSEKNLIIASVIAMVIGLVVVWFSSRNATGMGLFRRL